MSGWDSASSADRLATPDTSAATGNTCWSFDAGGVRPHSDAAWSQRQRSTRCHRGSEWGLTPLRSDPRLDLPFQHTQGHGARAQDDVVELADVESRTEPTLRALPQVEDPQQADRIGGRLPGVDDVALG